MLALACDGNLQTQLGMVQQLLHEYDYPIDQVVGMDARYGKHEFRVGWSALMVACQRACLPAVELVARRASASVVQHAWNHRLWVGAVLVARMNSRYSLAARLQRASAVVPGPSSLPSVGMTSKLGRGPSCIHCRQPANKCKCNVPSCTRCREPVTRCKCKAAASAAASAVTSAITVAIEEEQTADKVETSAQQVRAGTHSEDSSLACNPRSASCSQVVVRVWSPQSKSDNFDQSLSANPPCCASSQNIPSRHCLASSL